MTIDRTVAEMSRRSRGRSFYEIGCWLGVHSARPDVAAVAPFTLKSDRPSSVSQSQSSHSKPIYLDAFPSLPRIPTPTTCNHCNVFPTLAATDSTQPFFTIPHTTHAVCRLCCVVPRWCGVGVVIRDRPRLGGGRQLPGGWTLESQHSQSKNYRNK